MHSIPFHWDHTLCRASVLPKQSPWLLGTILDGSPLQHRIPASWHSFCQPWKDDRQSQPHLVLIQQPSGIWTQDPRIPCPPPEPVSQHQAENNCRCSRRRWSQSFFWVGVQWDIYLFPPWKIPLDVNIYYEVVGYCCCCCYKCDCFFFVLMLIISLKPT